MGSALSLCVCVRVIIIKIYMRYNQKILIISFFVAVNFSMANAQEAMPCVREAHDTESELREFGIGTDSTAFGALKNSVTDALLKIKPRYMKLYPDRAFEYALTIDKSEENIELDTSIGTPAIICNEISQNESGQFCVYVVLGVEVSEQSDESKIGLED